MRAIQLFRLCALFLACSAFAANHLLLRPDPDGRSGDWEIDLKGRSNRQQGLNLELRDGRNSRWQWLNEDRAPNIEKPKKGEALTFVIPAEAGDLKFRGEAKGNVAEGRYVFEANKNYADAAGKLLGRELKEEDLLTLAFADVTLSYIRDVKDSGVKAGLEEILKLRAHGLKAESIKEFVEVGFKEVADLVRLRNHGVTAEFARKTRAWQESAGAEELVKLKNHGVTPEYLAEWKSGGFVLKTDEAIKLRNHGVKPEYGAAWKAAGFDFTYDELIRARNHGVPSEFAAALKSPRRKMTLEEMIRLRNSGVTAEYFREMNRVNPNFTPEEIVRLRQNGVAVEYVAALHVEGRKPLDVEAILELRNRGVSAATARKLRE